MLFQEKKTRDSFQITSTRPVFPWYQNETNHKPQIMEKGMATHSSILAWKSPRTEEPGGLQSMGSHDWACVHEGGGRWVGSNKVVELKKKKSYRSISLKNIYAKILKKTLASWIFWHIKRIIHHEQMGHTLGMQDYSTYKVQSM